MTFTIGITVIGAILALAGILIVHRMVVGPSILDRAVGSDMLVVLLVLVLACYSAWSRTTYAGAAMLGLTGLGFLATVAVARFVAREDTKPAGSSADGGGAATEEPAERVLHDSGAAFDDQQGDHPHNVADAQEIGTEVPWGDQDADGTDHAGSARRTEGGEHHADH